MYVYDTFAAKPKRNHKTERVFRTNPWKETKGRCEGKYERTLAGCTKQEQYRWAVIEVLFEIEYFLWFNDESRRDLYDTRPGVDTQFRSSPAAVVCLYVAKNGGKMLHYIVITPAVTNSGHKWQVSARTTAFRGVNGRLRFELGKGEPPVPPGSSFRINEVK